MLPPVEESVLKNNPEFAALHHTLTTAILNPDGSSKKPLSKEHAAVLNELADRRLADAKNHLILKALETTVPPDPKPAPRTIRPLSTSQPIQPQPQPPSSSSSSSTTLPDPLLDLLLLLPPLLSSPDPLPADAAATLLSNPPLSTLEAHLPRLGDLLSANLHASAVSLARIANPTTNPSFLHRHVPALPTTYRALSETLQDSARALATERLAIAARATDLLAKHAAALTLLVRALEAKHGLVARSLELRAAETGLEARRAEIDAVAAADTVRAEVYSPDMVAALTNYAAHLRDARARLEDVVGNLRAELEGYGVGVEGGEAKERTLREMAKVKREMEKQLEDAKRDLERLSRA